MRIRASRIVPLIGAVSVALMLLVALADSAVARPPELVETGTHRLFGITVYPEGYAVEGPQIAKEASAAPLLGSIGGRCENRARRLCRP